MTLRPAIECRCPMKECTGWRQAATLGGGHITYQEAIELMRLKRERE